MDGRLWPQSEKFSILASVIGEWPSGKAVDSGSTTGVKNASGILQGNLLMETCCPSRSFGVAERDSNPYN